MGDSKTITVKTLDGDVVVRKLALGDYAALLRALKKLPAQFGQFVEGKSADELKDNATIFSALPGIIADAIPEFCEVLACASDRDAQFFEAGDLADALEVLSAALELNDYKRIVGTVKKMMAGKPAKPAPVVKA